MLLLPLLACAAAILLAARPAAAEPTLVGFAVLPADTFEPADDPAAHRSGQFIESKNNRSVPFATQPIQGISGVVAGGAPGTFLALSDNGYGTKANSADYVLTVYQITPHFRTGGGRNDTEKATVDAAVAFRLRDPDHKVPWPIVADAAAYPHGNIPVPAAIREGRLLTGADFDVESFVRLPDGTFWIGDEFGPFLLHASADGKLLEPPVELPGEGMHSPDHPTKDPATAKIQRSGGFEGLAAVDADGVMLLPILEKPLEGENGVRVFSFSADAVQFPGKSGYKVGDRPIGDFLPPLPLKAGVVSVGEATWFRSEKGGGAIFIERDGGEGDKASLKQLVYGQMRPLPKEQIADDKYGIRWQTQVIADLLNLADPRDLDGDGNARFRFPFLTIESVLPVDDRTVLVVNDNNYPFGNGRSATEPDATEFLLIRFDRPLAELGASPKTAPSE